MSLFGVGRLLGRELGIESLEALSQEGVERNALEAGVSMPSVAGFSDVEDMDSFFRWAAGSLGQAVPSLALAFGSGGVGAAVGRSAVASSVKSIIRQRMLRNLRGRGVEGTVADAAVEKALTSPQGFKMVQNAMVRGVPASEAIRQGTRSAASAGIFAGSALPQIGETDIQLSEAGIDSGFTSILAGSAGGILETIPLLRVLDRAFPGVDRVVSQAFVKDFVVGTGTQGLIEGSTEAAQTAIQLAAQAYHNPSFDMLDPLNVEQMTDAAAAGALVGGVLGFAGEGVNNAGAISASIRNRLKRETPAAPRLPTFNMPVDETPSDFIPADNTLFQEVKGRVNAAVKESFEPAINIIRDQFQSASDLITGAVPALGATVGRITDRARAAHEEFIAGHQHIIDDAGRWAREQVQFITETAQGIVGSGRQAFIDEKMKSVKKQVQDIGQVLKERADQVVQGLASQIDGQGVFDDTQISLDIERDTQFTFGKNNTRGEQVEGFKDRLSARKKIADLRKQFPSATDSTFGIRTQEDGTFIVALEDSGHADFLKEDTVVSEALEAARLSARRNPDKSRQVRIQRKDAKGRTNIDVKTLVFEGRKLDQGDNTTVAQGFAAMVGRMLERGIIDRNGADVLQAAFERQFPNGNAALTDEIRLENRIQRLEEQLTDIPQATLDTPEGQRHITKLREELHKLKPKSGRDKDVFITELDPRQDITEEVKIVTYEPTEVERQAQLDREAADIRKRSKKPTESKPKLAPKPKAKPKAKIKSSVTAEEQAEFEKIKAERAAGKDPTIVGPKPKKKPVHRPPQHPLKRAAKLNSKNKATLFMPGTPASIRNAIQEIADRAAALMSAKTKIRIIDIAGATRMAASTHVHAKQAQALIDHVSDFVVMRSPDGVTYILTDDFRNPGRSIVGLLHEIGHAIHYDTWAQLNTAQQDELWNAFVKDAQSGRRTTGQFINNSPLPKDFPKADISIFEFREWMADQFIDWMNNRRAPKNAIERFLESVAAKLDQMWQFLSMNPGRYNQLNETYAQFADAVAQKIRKEDATGNHVFYLNEGAGGRPESALYDAQGQGTAFPSPPGLTRSQWAELKDRLTNQYPVIAARTKLISDWMHNAYYLVLAPATSNMRTIAERVPSALKLVSIFNRELHGEAKKTKNYHQRMKLMKGRWLTQYEEITKGMTDNQKSALVFILRREKPPVSNKERQFRKLFDDIHTYMTESGLPVGFIENYFPRMFSKEKLIANEEKILRHIERAIDRGFSQQERAERAVSGETKKKARAFYNSLISEEADQAAALREVQSDEMAMQSPGFSNMRSRHTKDKFFDQFLDDNLDSVMGNYIISATKRSEFNRFLGSKAPRGVVGGDALPKSIWNSRGRIEKIMKAAEVEGATKADLKTMKNYVDANLGMFGRDDVSEPVRRVMATIVAYQNLRTLLFTVFASLPDIVGPAIRSGDMRLTFRTAIKNMRGIVKSDAALHDMARAWGVVSSAANQHVLTEYVDNHYMPPTLRKWNEKFFEVTGLNWFTGATRKMALAVGIDTIKSEAAKVEDQTLTQRQRDRAKQFLAELGLTADAVNVWVESGERVWGGLGYDQESANDQLIAEALVQFVDESIMSPNASQRPLLASHPAAMLIFHLKGYIYAMYDTVLKRLAHNFNIADTPAQVVAAITPALFMLMLTAFGLELRELITQDKRTNRMDGWDYTWTVVERSGLLGMTQLGFDFESAGARGQSELAALGGPTISQLGDLISRPLSQTIPKAIPGVSQLPWARNALRDVTPL
jgi:hypothetical protein